MHGQPTGLAAARLTWTGYEGGIRRQYAKWAELREPIEGGQFQPNLVPSTFYLQLSNDEEYHLPVVIDYEDKSGNNVSDIFCGWWYGQSMLMPTFPDLRFTASPTMQMWRSRF